MSGGSAPDDGDLRAAHARSLHNRADLSEGGACGRFYCLAAFDASEVRDWVRDTTALCPRCGIDPVLSARAAPIDPGFLRRMRARWFERAVQWDPSTPWPPGGTPTRRPLRLPPPAKAPPLCAVRLGCGVVPG